MSLTRSDARPARRRDPVHAVVTAARSCPSDLLLLIVPDEASSGRAPCNPEHGDCYATNVSPCSFAKAMVAPTPLCRRRGRRAQPAHVLEARRRRHGSILPWSRVPQHHPRGRERLGQSRRAAARPLPGEGKTRPRRHLPPAPRSNVEFISASPVRTRPRALCRLSVQRSATAIARCARGNAPGADVTARVSHVNPPRRCRWIQVRHEQL